MESLLFLLQLVLPPILSLLPHLELNSSSLCLLLELDSSTPHTGMGPYSPTPLLLSEQLLLNLILRHLQLVELSLCHSLLPWPDLILISFVPHRLKFSSLVVSLPI